MDAPISAGFTTLTAILSFVLQYHESSVSNSIKVLIRPLYFSSYSETMCGLALLHKLRLFERQWGSTKYSNFILISNGVSSLVACGLINLVCRRAISSLPCGPYGIIVASLVQFYLDVPVVDSSEHASLTALACLLAIKVSFSSRLNALVTTISGIMVGLAYRHPKIRSLTVPGTGLLAAAYKKLLFPLTMRSESLRIRRSRSELAVSRSAAARHSPSQPILFGERAIAPHVLGRQLLEGGFSAGGGQRSGLHAASRDALETLAGMGFHDRRRNEELLAAHGGDLARVVEHLLHSM